MFRYFYNKKRNKQQYKLFSAYTLAEVLVVMTIIMLILLALPPVTKKVFKITDTRKTHGRFECYWKTDSNGNKELWSFTREENGRTVETKISGKDYCQFSPGANTIYFLMYAVGGGGAGALIGERDLSDGTKVVVADLEPKQEDIQATLPITPSNPGAWPDFVTWFVANKPRSELPWYDATTTTQMKDIFDVNTIDSKQTLRYRLSGSTGSVVSTFLPSLPGNVILRIYPGKGGELNGSGYGSGEDGEDTYIQYVYEGKSPIEGLRARGGKGGNGKIDSKITYSLAGGPSTDFGLSSLAALEGKSSGFTGLIEYSKTFDMVNSKVPSTAGNAGNGESQFVTDTNGSILFEYDNNAGIVNGDRRILSDWKVISDQINSTFFRKPYYTTTTNCSLKTNGTFVVVEREGFCDFDTVASQTGTSSKNTYKCAIGKIPEEVLSSITKSTENGGDGWKKFIVEHDSSTDIYTVQNNPVAYSETNPFYDCKFDKVFTCKTHIITPKYYECNYTKKGTCSNGQTPMTRNEGSNKYSIYSTSKAEKAKCPASGGGDGAVVILW